MATEDRVDMGGANVKGPKGSFAISTVLVMVLHRRRWCSGRNQCTSASRAVCM
jgi:hypothetical protein